MGFTSIRIEAIEKTQERFAAYILIVKADHEIYKDLKDTIVCRDMSCLFGSYSNFRFNGMSLDVEDLRSAVYPYSPEDAAEYIKISPEEFLEDMGRNPMTQCYDLDIQHFLHLCVQMKGVPRLEESLNLRRILNMEDTEIMRIIYSFVKGPDQKVKKGKSRGNQGQEEGTPL